MYVAKHLSFEILLLTKMLENVAYECVFRYF